MPPPLVVFMIPGFALFFLVQMLLCEAYHLHVTLSRHKKYAREPGATKAIKNGLATNCSGNDIERWRNVDPEERVVGGGGGDDLVSETEQTISSVFSDQSNLSNDVPGDRLKNRRKSVFAESYDPATDDDYEKAKSYFYFTRGYPSTPFIPRKPENARKSSKFLNRNTKRLVQRAGILVQMVRFWKKPTCEGIIHSRLTTQIVHPKTPDEKQWLLDNLGSITLFQHLASDQIMTVVDAMYKNPVKNGDVIMKQGDKGNIFYVIQTGVFNVLVTDSSGREKLMHTYNNKGSFGELALLYNQPRAATIVAQSDGVLWAVDGQTFRRIVHKITYEKRLMYESLINHVPMLKALEPFECSNLVDALIPKTYQDKAQIIKQGEASDGMYFVVSGNVRIVVKDENGKEILMKILTGGEYFGELGLLTNKPRAASAFSVGVSTLAFLDREAFERLLGPCMDVMRRNINLYQAELEELMK